MAKQFIKWINQTIDEKTTLDLVCRVIGQPEPEVKWLRDDKVVTPGIKVKVTQDGDMHRLVTSNMTLKLGGVYKVVAMNPAGVAEHSATITVKGEFWVMMWLIRSQDLFIL